MSQDSSLFHTANLTTLAFEGAPTETTPGLTSLVWARHRPTQHGTTLSVPTNEFPVLLLPVRKSVPFLSGRFLSPNVGPSCDVHIHDAFLSVGPGHKELLLLRWQGLPRNQRHTGTEGILGRVEKHESWGRMECG